MDRFVNKENLERFRRLASAVTNEAERKKLLELLASEHAGFVKQQKAKADPESRFGATMVDHIRR